MRTKRKEEVVHPTHKEKAKENYPAFDTWTWRKYDGTPHSFEKFVEENKDNDVFFIGTDSHNKGKKATFTTAVVAYKKGGKGGRIIFHTDRTDAVPSVRQRLLFEAMRSLECAWVLNNKLNESVPISIHLDVNSSLHFESHKYKEELVGLIVSQGFTVANKPNAWAASKVAHNRCN